MEPITTTHIATQLLKMPLSWLLREAVTRGMRYIKRDKRTKFLEYDPRTINGWYHFEQKVGGYLPYKEEVNWLSDIATGRIPKIVISVISGQFKLNDGNEIWREVRDRAYQAFRDAGHAKSDSEVIRLNHITRSGTSTGLTVQKAAYRDQARSNLVLDYSSSENQSLRSLLRNETPGRLPALNDSRLANTIGMATLLLYPGTDGDLTPYLVRRQKNLAVFPGGVHVSSSCAAEWSTRAPTTFDDLFASDMYSEIKEEIGVEREELSTLYPLAICREFVRAGKPQLFFIATTSLRRSDLKERRQLATARNRIFNPQKIEILPDRLWSSADVVGLIESHWFLHRAISLEAMTAIHYLARLRTLLELKKGPAATA